MKGPLTLAGVLEALPSLPLLLGASTAVLAVCVSPWLVLPALLVSVGVLVYEGSKGYILFGIGAVLALVSSWRQAPVELPARYFDGREYTFSGCVDDVTVGKTSQRMVVTLDARGARPRCMIIAAAIEPQISPGDSIRFTGVAERLQTMADVPGMTAQMMFAKEKRVTAFFFLRNADILTGASSTTPGVHLWHLRRYIADKIYSTPVPPQVSSLLVSSWLGDKSDVDVRDSFRAVGLSHLLCISGFHLAVLAWLAALLLYPMKVWSRAGRLRYALILIVIWAFALLTGASLSVLRAALMITVFYLCRLLQRPVLPYNSLTLAVAVILILMPYSLFSLGFQLSVTAVLGILLFARPLNMKPEKDRRFHRLVELFAVPVAAMLGTLPVVLTWFNTVPLASVPVNAIACIIFPIFMLTGILYVVLFYMGFDVRVAAEIAEALERAMMNLCDFGARRLPAVEQLTLSPAGMAALVAALILLALVLHAGHRRTRLIGLGGIVAALVVIVAVRPPKTHQMAAWGNRLASTVCVADGTRGYVATNGRRVDSYSVAKYFAACGIDADSITYYRPADRRVTLGRVSIALPAASDTVVDGSPDYILLPPLYRGDINRLAAAHPRSCCIAGTATPTVTPVCPNVWYLSGGALVLEH